MSEPAAALLLLPLPLPVPSAAAAFAVGLRDCDGDGAGEALASVVGFFCSDAATEPNESVNPPVFCLMTRLADADADGEGEAVPVSDSVSGVNLVFGVGGTVAFFTPPPVLEVDARDGASTFTFSLDCGLNSFGLLSADSLSPGALPDTLPVDEVAREREGESEEVESVVAAFGFGSVVTSTLSRPPQQLD